MFSLHTFFSFTSASLFFIFCFLVCPEWKLCTYANTFFAWFLLGIIYSFYMSFCKCLSQFPSKPKKNLLSFLRKRSQMHLLEYYQEDICGYSFLEILIWALWYTFPSTSVPFFFNIETYRTDILVFALYLHQHDDTLCLHGVYYIFCSFS